MRSYPQAASRDRIEHLEWLLKALAAAIPDLSAVLRSRPVAVSVPTEEPRYLTTAQAAVYLGVSRSTVSRLQAAGKIPVCRPSKGLVRFDRLALDRFMTGNREG